MSATDPNPPAPSETNEIIVERLQAFSETDAKNISNLLPLLSKRFADAMVSSELLQEIIDSPYHDIIVARDDSNTIVGIAALSETIGLGDGHEALLDDFVVSPDMQGQGVGKLIWQEIMAWCRNKNVSELMFTSKPQKVAANNFYVKNGAVLHESNIYKVKDFS